MLFSQIKIFFVLPLFSFLLFSCSDNNPVTTSSETLLFQMPGLVDSAVVFGCYPLTRIYEVPDILQLNNYSKLKIEFDGQVNSDGTIIFVVLYNEAQQGNEVYRVENISNINRLHSFETSKPDNMATMRVRLYINPPICGQNEFKYNRVRDLKVYGVK